MKNSTRLFDPLMRSAKTWLGALALSVLLAPMAASAQPGGSCTADAGTLNGFKGSDCLQDGGTAIGGIAVGDAFIPAGYERIYVLTRGEGLVIEQVRPFPIFDVTSIGLYTIHTLVYDPTTLDLSIVEFGVTTGFDVNALLIQGGGSICASLDVTGTSILVDNPDAGTLTAFKDEDCLEGGTVAIGAVPNGDIYVPAGYSVIYVLTEGPGLVIQQVRDIPIFDVTEPGSYTVHTLVYDPTTLDLSIVELGVTTGFDVNGLLFQGGGNICASLDVPGAVTVVLPECPCEADAGTVNGFKASDCLQEGGTAIGAIPNGDAVVPPGYAVLYVLTEGPGLVIQQVRDVPIFDVTETGAYTIHTLVYNPATLDLSIVELGVTTGFDVNALLIQGGGGICASLDVTGTSILVDNPDAGTLTPFKDEDCLEEGTVAIGAVPNGDIYVPAGYSVIYVLTEGPGLVIQGVRDIPIFDVDQAGSYTVHTLVYDPSTLDLSIVELGVTTGFDVNGLLIQGGGAICASLDVAGAVTVVTGDCEEDECAANAGTLTLDEFEACLNGDNSVIISATPNEDSIVPDGYSVVYVLTQGEGLVIVNAGADPSFEITEAGSYTIHTLVYDAATLDLDIVELGVTTGFDVNGLLIQGGGAICASLDVAGANFTIDDCPEECFAGAGTLSADVFEGCVNGDNSVTISATPNGDSTVPPGFSVVYVLTQGEDLVIVNAGAEPMFDVTEAGSYTIHTLVYDANTLDLSIVEFGVTTGFDVNGLIWQGGGEICASLDVTGAPFTIDECLEECSAFAGTLTADEFEGCVNGDNSVVISATANDDSNVPDGYSVVYVLTQGEGLVIVNAGADPSFSVTEAGSYTIHTLVYDATTLDLSIVEFGVTTGFDVNGLIIQGGGDICASLDVAGASFTIDECLEECSAFAGTLTADEFEGCVNGDNSVVISATANDDSNVPDGYSVVYVLTQGEGLVIVNAGADPSFSVTEAGSYTIHTLVYDAATLDLSIVELGVTTGFDVNGLIIQGGGEICASLDVAGASFTIDDCLEECTAFAGSLSGNAIDCLESVVTLSAEANGDSNVPAGFSVVYVLTQGNDLVIINAGAEPSFEVEEEGLYTIHTLVYDAATLDLAIVELGITTGFDVNSLIIQGGGEICASLDVAGAAFTVESCSVVGPENDECDGAIVVGNGTTPFSTEAASSSEVDGCAGNNDIWFSYTATCTGTVEVNTCGSSFDTILGAFSACGGEELACNDDATGCGLQSRIVLDMEEGQTILIRVGGFGTATGTGVLNISCSEPVTIENDDCDGAITVSDGTTPFTTVGATTSGQVGCTMNGDIWFSYTATCTGPVEVNTCGSFFDTILAAFTTCGGQELACNDDATGCGLQSRIVLDMEEGETILIRVGGFGSGSGAGVLNITCGEESEIVCVAVPPADVDVNSDAYLTVITEDAFCCNNAWDGLCQDAYDNLVGGGDMPVVDNELELSAWPSPTNQFLNVEARIARGDRAEFTVLSMQGAVVIPTTVMPAGQRMVIDVQNLRPGQYMIRVVSGDKVATERFMRMD